MLALRVLCLAVLVAAAAAAQSPVANPGFEAGAPGGIPPGWRAPAMGYMASVSAQGCNSGRQCAVLRYSGASPATGFGTLLQSIPAEPYRGKKFRYRAAVRTEGQTRAQLWLRVDLSGGGMGFFDNMGDRAISSSNWAFYEISGSVDRTAQSIFLGLLMPGAGAVWIDEVSFEITGDADPVEPARPLSSRGLENLQALARLYGYVRFFHPSDEAAAADWNQMAIDAVRKVESAASPAELAARLQAVFGPIAPTVRVIPTGSPMAPLDLKPASQIIQWQHHGLGLSPQSVYNSTRVVRPTGDLPQPIRRDLPGGVTCMVPTALYRDNAAVAAPNSPRAGGTGDDRATRLAAVIIAWNVMQHFYPYFDVAKTDWSAELPTALTAAARDADSAAFATTLRRLVAALHDGHGNVSGGGIGVSVVPPVLWTWADGRIVALTSSVDTIRPGDALLTIDGRPAAEVLAAKEALISSATLQWKRYRALLELLGRSAGASVQVEIERAGGPQKVTLQATVALGQLQEPRPNKFKELEPGIFYLDLNRITDADLAMALPSLTTAKGIVFDLRGYPLIQNPMGLLGQLMDRPGTSAQWNIPEVTRPDRENIAFTRSEWSLQPVAPYLKAKRAFIVDGRAISYAESVMGIVEYYKLAEIVGEPTAGTNGNVNPLTLPGGYSIMWTGMKVLKQDGSQHHGVGIRPTIPVSRTREGIAAGRDEMLERAILAVKQ